MDWAREGMGRGAAAVVSRQRDNARKGLDKLTVNAKKYANFRHLPRSAASKVITPVYEANPAVATLDTRSQMTQCKHPRVQIVSRDEDSEFVECLECGDIFESSEFKDMNIEETKLNQES